MIFRYDLLPRCQRTTTQIDAERFGGRAPMIAAMSKARRGRDVRADGSLKNQRAGFRAGFTVTELIVAIAIIAILLALLFPALIKVRSAQRGTACFSNLRQISAAFHLYAQDNSYRLPQPATANRSWEQMLSPYLRGKFLCPADDELAIVVGSSYDWRDTGIASTTLAGRSLAETLRTNAILTFEALPGWHARGTINVSRLDNSVTTISEAEFFSDIDMAITGPFVPIKN
jgi:prepilin-type N-terminal cleavage/methylation domain-containing protein